jgi:hypothetical protein
MSIISELDLPSATLSHHATTIDATEELLILGQDHAFVKKDDKIIGIVCLENLLVDYKLRESIKTTVADHAEPLFSIIE